MSIDTRVNQDSANTITEERTAPPAQITISQIVEDLENGRDRQTIKAKYGLTADEVKMIFEHPKLKGMRVKKARTVRFTLVDDMQKTVTQINLEDSIQETTAIVDVQSFPSSGGWDTQTRVEEGLDYKGEYAMEEDTVEEASDMLYGVDNNQTEIQD